MRARWSRWPLLLSLCACTAGPPSAGALLTATPACFGALAERLSEDSLEGRGAGTEGLEVAAALIEERMRALRLAGPYRQPFHVAAGVSLGDGNALSNGTIGVDFAPLGFSSSGAFAGEIVLAGYGIRASALGYDDYDGIDARGKVVLAMRDEPGAQDHASPFDGRKPSRYADVIHKAVHASTAGATALLLVNPPVADRHDRLPGLQTIGLESRVGLPVVQVTREWVRRTLGDGMLEEVHRAIDAGYRPRSRLTGVAIRGVAAVSPTEVPVDNVIGLWPGLGTLANEVVVIGAHYDHLGYGPMGTVGGAIHNGADDNASGVAAMLCAVGELRVRPPVGNRRSLLVIAFAGEELGLVGSRHYTTTPRAPLGDTVAMLNLDMVGRVRGGRVIARGAQSAREWPAWLSAATPAGLTVVRVDDGFGSSDDLAFHAHQIPTMHLFTGTHPQYHSPSDVFETLNVTGGGHVATLSASLLRTLMTTPDRPTFTPNDAASTGKGEGWTAALGAIPDDSTLRATEGGVRLSLVREDGPVALAGVRDGDVVVGISGHEIRNVSDMSYVLRAAGTGDEVEIVVLRGEQRLAFSAKLGQPRAQP